MSISRIGVVGDVHAEDARLEAILDFLSAQEICGLFCVGDIVDGVGDVDRCCDLLTKFDVSTVLGNHDQWCVEGVNRSVDNATVACSLSRSTVDYLQSLPRTIEFDTPSGKAQICHGLGDSNMAAVRRTDLSERIFDNLELWSLYRDAELRFVVNGHSHRPDVHFFDHLTVINAGSCNQSDIASALVIDFEVLTVDFLRVSPLSQVQCIAIRSVASNTK